MDEQEEIKYANVGWTAGDIQTLAPRMSDEEAEEWLNVNQTHIRDRITEVGWDIIGSLLAYDGIDTSDDEEQDDS